MAYFILTHGVGTDPAHHMTTEYREYKKAKRALAFLFDCYQEDLEKGKIKSFACILKTIERKPTTKLSTLAKQYCVNDVITLKGVFNNGNTEKEENKKVNKNK
ncbi:MAG: hypothetical protein IK122_02905 [Alphaproteobacteria bacterium]|nr:hypothetical protein [Alphaproteobacteria bacterium]